MFIKIMFSNARIQIAKNHFRLVDVVTINYDGSVSCSRKGQTAAAFLTANSRYVPEDRYTEDRCHPAHNSEPPYSKPIKPRYFGGFSSNSITLRGADEITSPIKSIEFSSAAGYVNRRVAGLIPARGEKSGRVVSYKIAVERCEG